MNTTDPPSNTTFTSHTDNVTLSILATTSTSATTSQPTSYSSNDHDPEFTIMVVLGLSLLLAGLAIFMAVWRRIEQDRDFEASWTQQRGLSSEPQLKVWKRLGSYRRAYNISFRRPPQRMSYQHDRRRTSQPLTSRTPQVETNEDPHPTTPSLQDYVTEV